MKFNFSIHNLAAHSRGGLLLFSQVSIVLIALKHAYAGFFSEKVTKCHRYLPAGAISYKGSA
ncbi:hypothetical protein [Pedobacter cryophilus]|uniref:Uncharacterized protein n=1 Tax=Pedobacter cryophilus TaxID=2571271 RepID=A0A4U1BVS9_9SPHI|nr:hypothetical protein [Pedobacter cryophilus]TKB96939.1 hypothetical protein FA046_12760 [Pedobacter cryophilus]